jgi:L-fuconolactonase
MIIDAHLHLWQRHYFDYSWIQPGSRLDRDFDLEDLRPTFETLRVVGGILVEAANMPDEINWLLLTAEAMGPRWGVIGWIDADHPDAPPLIARLAQRKRFKGVRSTWLVPRTDQTQFDATVRALDQHRLAADVLVQVEQLLDLVRLAAAYPGVTFVIEHLGGLLTTPTVLSSWRVAMQALTRLPNVVLKVSGLINDHKPPPSHALLRAAVETALELFGARRLMFGSNWPVAPDYLATVTLLAETVQDIDKTLLGPLFYQNAADTYSL